MIYVCLLRGINVGGKNKVEMKKLKSEMLTNGFQNVVTYINSGNIIFESEETDILKLQGQIHGLIINVFDVDSKTLVISKEQFVEVAEMIPPHFKNDDEFKADVLFYYHDITQELIDTIPMKEGVDEAIYLKNAMIVGVSRKNQPKSGLIKIVGTNVYMHLTIRNVNTVRKIKELL